MQTQSMSSDAHTSRLQGRLAPCGSTSASGRLPSGEQRSASTRPYFMSILGPPACATGVHSFEVSGRYWDT